MIVSSRFLSSEMDHDGEIRRSEEVWSEVMNTEMSAIVMCLCVLFGQCNEGSKRRLSVCLRQELALSPDSLRYC